MSQVSYGTITIVDTNDIESITIEYAQNQDSSNPPSSGWDTVRPTWRQNYFIWQRTRIHKSGTTADKDSFGAAVCLTGSTGATGSTGQSLSTTKTQYTHVASNVTITTSNHTSYTWTDNVPEYDSTKPVYWGRITNTYINPAKTEYIIYKDNGLTEAIANSVEANTNASDALDKANESNSIAIHANENAQGALSISRATQQHFWFNSTTSGSIEAGAYITDTPIDTFKSGKNGGYLLARSDGLELGRGTNKFMTLSATALNFYRPGTNTIDATLTSNGLILTKGGLKAGTYNASAADANQNFVYLSSEDYGTAIQIGDSPDDKTDWRQIIGKNFGVDKAGNLYAGNVNIHGLITVDSGSNVYTIDESDTLLTNVKVAADIAAESASSASSSANRALAGLSIVEDVVGTLTWLSEHAEFSLTEDTEVDTSKQYYEALWGYFPTEDTEIDQSKTYYVRSGEGTDEDPYVYTVVTSPSMEHLSEYYEYKFTGYEPILLSEDDSPTGYYEITSIDEAVTNFIGTHLALTEQGLWVTADADNEYKVLVASDGVYIYGPSGQISKFGEDIEFSSLRPQHIGGDDTYIEFNPSTNKLNIVADDIVIGGKNALERIETFENTVPSIQNALTSQAQSIHTQQESLDILTGYVDISPTQSRIRVGDKTSTSYVEISGKSDDLRVSINIDGKDVAYMAHNRFYAPSAVVSNLYMQTALSGDNPIGAIGWVMRSNGHLSLKRIK